jgi:hypothetical protein
VDEPRIPHAPGWLAVARANGKPVAGDARRPGAAGQAPGSALIGWAAWLLALIGAGALYVSFDAQRQYVFGARHQDGASVVEALLLDLLMITFTLLALGLSRAGKSSRTERALILACAAASAYMNVSAADTASPRSIAAYAVAPVALAVVVDRVIAVIRRHVLADDEASAWAVLGRGLAAAARLAATALLYLLRFALAPPSTAKGLRRWVLAATPLPEAAPDGSPRGLVTTGHEPGAPRSAPLPCAQHPPELERPARAEAPGPAPAAAAHDPGLAGADAPDPHVPPERGAARAAVNGNARAGSPAAHRTTTPAAVRESRHPPARQSPAAGQVTFGAVRAHYAPELAAGRVPSGKDIRRQFGVGSDRAGQFVEQLAPLAASVRPAR